MALKVAWRDVTEAIENNVLSYQSGSAAASRRKAKKFCRRHRGKKEVIFKAKPKGKAWRSRRKADYVLLNVLSRGREKHHQRRQYAVRGVKYFWEQSTIKFKRDEGAAWQAGRTFFRPQSGQHRNHATSRHR